jgi:L,D-transpeptidase-like protein
MTFRCSLFPRATPHEIPQPFASPCRPDFHRGGGRETICAHQRHANGQAYGATLKPGEYWWRPQLSPNGPLIVLISVPEQVMHVYRNGILIGRSTVSTGSTGHATPGGVFSILEKKQEHYSKTYDNAPMPNMQRLTWTGIATVCPPAKKLARR